MDQLLNDVVLEGTRLSASLPPLPPKPQAVFGQLTANQATDAAQPTNRNLKRTVASRKYSQRYRQRGANVVFELETQIKALQADILLMYPQIMQLKQGIGFLKAERTWLQEKVSLCSVRLSSGEAYCEELKRESDLLKQISDISGQQKQLEASLMKKMENNFPVPVVNTNGPDQQLESLMGNMELNPPFPVNNNNGPEDQPVITDAPNQKLGSSAGNMESGEFSFNADIGPEPELEPWMENMENWPFPVDNNSGGNQFNYMNDFLMDPDMLFPFDINLFV